MAARILLVEADVVLGAVLGEVLRHNGYEVIPVGSLRDQVADMPPVDAIVLDLDTPYIERELTWLELLLSSSSAETLPIVLMGLEPSGDFNSGLLKRLGRHQAGQLRWIQKPFRNEELLVSVEPVNGNALTE